MFTVTELTAHIRHVLEEDATLQDVWLEGEVSNFSRSSAGHCYFTLKDRSAAISCVMWRSAAQRLTQLPGDGDLVLAHGNVSLYESQGRLQFYADHLQPAGLGRLFAQLEALKAQLGQEGLFDQERKRPLPAWPRRIGLVTSPRAAALRDILRTLAGRYPLADVLLAPTAVQGADAPAGIIAAIELLNAWHFVEPVDLIIVARGGGSIEELWAFNDEGVARAIAASRLPVISGVGHETDFTLADLVADRRAATPTAAATAAVPDGSELQAQVAGCRQRALRAVESRLRAERQASAHWTQALQRNSPQSRVLGQRQRVDELDQAAGRLMRHRLALQRVRLEGVEARLASLDPQAVLARGYAVVRRADDDRVVTSASQVAPGDRLRTLLSDGEIQSVVSAGTTS